MNRVYPLLASFLLFTSVAHAANFPGADWDQSSPSAEQMDSAKIKNLTDYVFEETKEKRTDALLIIRHGKIVFEKYNYGYTANMRHLSWSMAKSFSSIVFGIAESEGLIKRDSKMVDFYPYPAATAEEQAKKNQVTMYSLLTMSSGIQWKEDYGRSSPLQSDVTQMLYLDARRDMAAYVASRPMDVNPYDRFQYSTGNTNVVMGALKLAMNNQEAYNQYPWVKLFNKIGMKNVVWEQDGAGTFGGGSYVYATARDYARFGYLLLNDGKWNQDQIVPLEWMKTIKVLSPGLATGTVQNPETETYGAGFWLNIPAPKFNIATPYPAAPADTFLAIGHNGQTITVIPSQDLVIVRLAHDSVDSGIDRAHYLDLVMQTLVSAPRASSSSLPEASASVSKVSNRARADLSPPPVKRTSIFNFTKLVASVRAKDFCSCHFIVGQTVAFCKELVKNGFPFIRMSVNESAKKVTFGILPAQSAALTSEELGCSFQ